MPPADADWTQSCAVLSSRGTLRRGGDASWRNPQSRSSWQGLLSPRRGRQALRRCRSCRSQRARLALLTVTSWTLDGVDVGATAGGVRIAAGAGATVGDEFAVDER